MSAENKVFVFNIAGLPFRLRSPQDEGTVKELVQFVDQKVQQAMSATKSGSLQSAAVLAALNIAEELFLMRRRALREIEHIEEKALRLSQELEQSKNKGSSAQPVNP
ncbi:MAG: cell division protein ZapA [Bdellovibrio sp.]|nr:MAG: cell division protein ZapA [Bdellovibrio sp.]